jgi:hypothetical protein
VNNQALALLKKLNVKPEDNPRHDKRRARL